MDECDGALDALSVDVGLECEMWDYDEGLLTWDRDDEPLAVEPLASANLINDKKAPAEEDWGKENGDSN